MSTEVGGGKQKGLGRAGRHTNCTALTAKIVRGQSDQQGQMRSTGSDAINREDRTKNMYRRFSNMDIILNIMDLLPVKWERKSD